MRNPSRMTYREMVEQPWFKMTQLVLTVTAAVIVVITIVGLLTGCTPANLPPPQMPPATGQSVTESAAPTTLPVPTTTAPLVTPRSTTAAEPNPDVTWSGTVPVLPPGRTTSQGNTQAPTTVQTPETGQRDTAQVVRIYDADTITVMVDGAVQQVRLLGIDAPELENPGLGITGECYGEQARDDLRAHLPIGSDVTLVSDDTQADADRSGRLLRYVEVRDDQGPVDLSGWLLQQGDAWVYEQFPVQRTPFYRAMMEYAQAEHAGLWAACE